MSEAHIVTNSCYVYVALWCPSGQRRMQSNIFVQCVMKNCRFILVCMIQQAQLHFASRSSISVRSNNLLVPVSYSFDPTWEFWQLQPVQQQQHNEDATCLTTTTHWGDNEENNLQQILNYASIDPLSIDQLVALEQKTWRKTSKLRRQASGDIEETEDIEGKHAKAEEPIVATVSRSEHLRLRHQHL